MIGRPRDRPGGAEDMNRPLPKLSGSPPTLLVGETRAEALKAESLDLPSITLGQRQLCDLELLLNGGFSPLTGFMDEATYESVLQSLRLPDASLWPVPVTLDVDERMAQTLESGARVALRDSEGFMLAVLDVSACWKVDKDREAQSVYGTRTKRHPGGSLPARADREPLRGRCARRHSASHPL